MACHILLESFWQGLQFCFQCHFNRRFTQEVMDLQSHGSPNFKNFGTPNLGVRGQNDIWMQPLCLITENTIRGKVVASPKSRQWWILWVHVCLWFVRAPKVFQLRTNQLIVWFVQVCVNNWPTCHLFLVPILELQYAPLPPKCYELRSVPQFLFLSLFSPLDS
jgi:hypothetical protein